MVLREIQTAKNIIKEKGVIELSKTVVRTLAHMCLTPYYTTRLKLTKFASNEELINYAYNSKLETLKPCQHKSEISELVSEITKRKPKHIMELGTGKGGNLFLLCRAAPSDAKIISLDMRGGPYGAGYPSWKIPLLKSFASQDQQLTLVDADSHNINTVTIIQNILNGETLDLLFIDGDHTYEGVKKDFELYNHFVRPGGLIVFHDIVNARALDPTCNVDLFWNELKWNYNFKEVIDNPTQIWGGLGIIEQNGT